MADSNLGLGTDNPFLGRDNPYLQQIIDSASGDLVDNWNKVQLPAMNAAAVRSGSFGNTALDELNNFGAQGLQKNLGDLTSKLRFNDYSQQQQEYNWQKNYDLNKEQWNLGFDKSVYDTAFNQNQQNLQTGIGLLGTLNQFNTQDINNTTTQQNTPLSYWQQFLNSANGVGQGFGTSTGTVGTTSNPAATALGGAQLGSSWLNRNGSGSTPPSGYSSWDSYNYGNSGGGDSLGAAGTAKGWW